MKIFLGLSLLVLLGSCASFPRQVAYQTRIGVQDLLVEIGRPTADGLRFQITGPALEGAKLSGSALSEGSGYRLTIERLDWFHNWADGWTEAAFDASGVLLVVPEGENWKATVVETPRIDDLKTAALRLMGDYFYADQAVGLLGRRWERIQSAVEALLVLVPDADNETLDPEFRWDLFRGTKSFRDAVRPTLFPEVYGYPAGVVPGSEFTTGEGVRWDVAYTNRMFPEGLRPVRLSGTLLRDFEESPGLWRLAYQWKTFWEKNIPSAVFHLEK